MTNVLFCFLFRNDKNNRASKIGLFQVAAIRNLSLFCPFLCPDLFQTVQNVQLDPNYLTEKEKMKLCILKNKSDPINNIIHVLLKQAPGGIQMFYTHYTTRMSL